MKCTKFLFILIFFTGINSFAQKSVGYGGELSVLSIKPNVRIWISKTTGFEVFAGLASELANFNPNDAEVGFKILKTIQYNRAYRTYFGFVGKWKWLNVYGESNKINLPIPGLLIGKEWYIKKRHHRGFAIEVGYQYGVKEYVVYNPVSQSPIGNDKYEEFPLIINLRYSFYKKK